MALRFLRSSFFAAFITLLTIPGAHAQYCVTNLGGASFSSSIDSVSIVGTTLAKASPGSAATLYTLYPQSGNTTASLMQGQTYTLYTVYGFSAAIASMWIDYNQNTTFEASEWTQITTNALTATASFTVPLSATTGSTRMRIRSRGAGNQNGAGDACTTFGSGETEDYVITITAAPACTGTPVVTGVNPAGPIVVCNPNIPVTLSVSAGVFSGFTYAWQQSINGGVTWTPTGATTATATFVPGAPAVLYRAIVTCSTSTQSDTSNDVSVSVSGPLYATVPYVQDFEQWMHYCDSFDVPSNNWSNTPATGTNSWRRYDQGQTAFWGFSFGDYFPNAYSGQHSARWNSYGASTGDTGNLNLHLNLSTQTGPKQLYFYHINQDFAGEDSLSVQLSTDGGLTYTTLASFDTATTWKRRTVPINSNSATAVLRFQGQMNGFFDFSDIGLDSVYVAPPCAGTPEAGILVPGPTVAGCPGGAVTFSLQGASLSGGLTYVWQQAASCTTGAVYSNIPGATAPTYTTPTLTSSRSYRVIVTCTASGLSDTAGPTCINITPPAYATLPYVQDFETWSTRCAPSDIPDSNWASSPPTGDASWRRNDQGALANWTFPPGGAYTPGGFTGQHSARFHSYFVPSGVSGNLDLFVNASAPGTKELQFHYISANDFFSFDSLKVYLSTNNGVSFSLLAGYDTTAGGNWMLKTIPFTSTSATTILRFQGIGDFGNSDIGIDNVKVLLPCTGTPNAGTVTPLTPCSGAPFNLTLTSATQAAGLTYQWQQSTNGVNWTAVPGGTQQVVPFSITQPTYFRAIVTCANSGLSATTPTQFFAIADFYYCYCQSGIDPQTFSDPEDIGNVTLREVPGAVLFSNGVATPLQNNPAAVQGYTNFTGLPADTLYKAASYSLAVTQISQSSFFGDHVAAAYIDYNRDGDFDAFTEQVYFKAIVNTATQRAIDTFIVPATADTGLTGLRVVMTSQFSTPQPCNLDFSGETEDYLVYLSLPRCTATPAAGTAFSSDTTICLGDDVILIDTGYTQGVVGLSYEWEAATDPAGPWTLIAGSQNQDIITVTGISDTMYYRFRIACSYSSQSATGNLIRVTVKQPIQCYCPSYATGDLQDMSDANALAVGPFIVNNGGPHLNNPVAIYPYTDRTQATIAYLEVDSAYDLTVYHAMRNSIHQDVKVTLFMDFNNNFQYDIPQERVFTGYTTINNPFANGLVTIPASAVTGEQTGMRLIVNEDTGPSQASDEACGTYFSGETEDYAVIFLPQGGLGVPRAVGLLSSVQLFPNPAIERTSLRIAASKPLGTVDVTVSNLTGQTILRQAYLGTGSTFNTELNLGDVAHGVYFVEVRAGGERVVRKLVVR
jgi:hypothetical protein